jgi:hypothetical protein
MLFLTNNTERASIDSSGNLLVGTTAAINTSKVAVNSGSQSIAIEINKASGTYYPLWFYNASNTVGYIQSTASSTSYATSSDYRLKENVAPMQNALATVQQLKPVTYTWKSNGEVSQGFIAHELQAIVPDCVTGEKDGVDAEGNPQYQGIDTSFLVATLTAAIQEQQAIITALAARVEALEGAQA